jgi:hypothetical protein
MNLNFSQFDLGLKRVLEYKAQLITAKSLQKVRNLQWFIKNTQPISVGV